MPEDRDARTKKARAGEPTSPPAAPAPQAVRLHRADRPPGVVVLDHRRTYTIGRGTGADLYFDDEAVSRVHAHLKWEDDRWVLADVRSANGTFAATRSGPPSVETFAEARELRVGEPLTLATGHLVFFGDPGAALEPLAALDEGERPAAEEPDWPSERGRKLRRDLERAARSTGPVLLIGPSGAGKTHAARLLHDRSGRPGRFLALNAAALPLDPTQLKSALLGHKRGAFTGADRDLEGAWFATHQGTLFLDEVDSLSPSGQGFLLTLLEQTADLTPLGAPPRSAPARVDVRVIAASKVPLAEAGLRQDLAFRLVDGAIVELPSLEERAADIPLLVEELLQQLAREDGAAVPFSFLALEACQQAAWPGEVRQLRSLVRALARDAAAIGKPKVDADEVEERLAAMARALGSTLKGKKKGAARAAGVNPRRLTQEQLQAALDDNDGNIQRTADALGIARRTLMTKMDKLGIERPGRRK